MRGRRREGPAEAGPGGPSATTSPGRRSAGRAARSGERVVLELGDQLRDVPVAALAEGDERPLVAEGPQRLVQPQRDVTRVHRLREAIDDRGELEEPVPER